MRLLVTGAAGFIGSCFARRAIARGDSVVALDLLTYAGHMANLDGVTNDPHLTFVRGDIRDAALLRDLLATHQPDAIVHFAAESHVDRSIAQAGAFVSTNVLGTQALLDAARAHGDSLNAPQRSAFRFLHVSTDEVFGSLGAEGSFTEASPYAPRSPYAASKAGADHLVHAAHVTHGLPVLLTHGSNTYGPRQFPEKLVPVLILAALQGRPLPIYGSGDNVRDWMHVADHCAGIEAVLARGTPGRSYCLGGGVERSNLDLCRLVCCLLDEAAPRNDGRPHASAITLVADRPGHDFRYASDCARIRAETGWAPRIGLEDGLRETIGWYRNNPAWLEAIGAGRSETRRASARGA